MVVTPQNSSKGPAHVWCRFCGAWSRIDEAVKPEGEASGFYADKQRYEIPEPTLNPEIVDQLVSDLADHESFFLSRGLSLETIRRYRLGYHRQYHRYAIPCYFKGRLYGVKYRIDPSVEKSLKEKGEKYSKYISEKGGVNNVLFNDRILSKPLPYLLIDEGEMDAMLLTQHGFPAISPFSGNNASNAWPEHYAKAIWHVQNIFVIAQNDEAGGNIAYQRWRKIGRGEIIKVPDGYKDTGEWIRSMIPCSASQIQRNIINLLRLPPVDGLYDL